ncbi:V-type ATP synthase subunit I [Bacterioplanes sanyensis]|uniref:V-type ATP synthase subunit I n=1 Tax=Bacterioplanes sanyensis TaxID=1249553 RepID=UPI001677127F|nr:V-type ATP synthase subunit I [Bacterioplanes sanyensis]GGY37217.1 V-type ATP synthase subunit I [Bacterioplanes sanyensis]
MSIARFRKILLAGPLSERQRLLRSWQAFGRLHIISRDGSQGFERQLSPRDKRAYEAMKHLQLSANARRPLQHWPKTLLQQHNVVEAANQLVDDVLDNANQIRQVGDEADSLRERINALRPWGDFRLPPDSSVDKFRLWFYRLPVNQRDALDELELPWQIAGRSSRFYYLIVVSATEPPVDLLPVPREHLGSRSLQQLELELEASESRLEDLQLERERLTRFRELLRRHLVAADNEAVYRYVMAQTEQHQQLFSLSAWVPEEALAELDTMATELGFAWSAADPLPEEQPPTLLQPAKALRPGAMLASVYQLPAYRSWDPSGHLYLSFVLFFAMILSDAGYSLVLLLALGVFWRSLGRNDSGRTLRQLMVSLLGGALCWGVAAGSYLGYDIAQVAPDYWLAGLKVIDLSNYDAMMKISVIAGVGHVIVANLSLAWARRRQWSQVVTRLAWVVMTAAGLGAWLLPAQQTHMLILAGVAAAAILLFAAWPSQGGLKQRAISLGKGALALANVTKLFGDVLSYMRLFALGLASASLGLTFNDLAAGAAASSPGVGIVSAALIFLLGHSINLALAIMSGVVHGLRLNFIEFYNWGEPGEGYAYQPFRLREN